MGLDHALHRRDTDMKKKILNSLDGEDNDMGEELICWRKVYHIHDYMCDNFNVENCESVMLTKEDLMALVDNLEAYLGHFWGGDEESEYWEEDDYKDWVIKINEVIEKTDWEKQEVFYWAWW